MKTRIGRILSGICALLAAADASAAEQKIKVTATDAMGTPGQIEKGYDLGTYEGMIKHNLNTMVDALK